MTTVVAQLQTCLEHALGGRAVRVLAEENLKTDVRRVHVDIDGSERSLVVKRSDPVVARRAWLVARRWLPAAGLAHLAPSLLGLAPESSGEAVWQVWDDIGGHALATDPPVACDVDATIDAIARIHTGFASHPLLGECRRWGGDRGIDYYSAHVRDAVIALRSLHLNGRGPDAVTVRDSLLDRLHELREEEHGRARAMAAVGGPVTLLHGDLWPTNAIVVPGPGGVAARLVDWDEAGAGPAWYDVSTLLLRFDPSQRNWILGLYERAVDRLAGWRIPPRRALNVVMETAAYGRLASLLVWSVAAAHPGESDWLFERLAAMTGWFDAVRPVLPAE